MKFYDTRGRQHRIDVRPSKWPRKEIGSGRGKFQSQVGEILQDLFAGYYVLEEFPCLGDGLYLDFFIPAKGLAVEVQGAQHHKFNPFFHKDKAAFVRQVENDKRKAQWCEINEIRLVKINWGESEENIKKALA
jgi:hypothetical protein